MPKSKSQTQAGLRPTPKGLGRGQRRRRAARRFTPSGMNSTSSWEVSPVVAAPATVDRGPQETSQEVRLLQAQVAQLQESISTMQFQPATPPAPHLQVNPPPVPNTPLPQQAPSPTYPSPYELPQHTPVLPGMPTSPILPLYTLLSKETRDAIATGEYIDFSSLTAKGQDEVQKPTKTSYLTPTAWARAAARYASTLLVTQPQEAQNLLVYIDSVLQLAEDGGDWLAYDRQFRKQKQAGNYTFGAMRVELYTRAMSSQPFHKKQPFRGSRDANRASDIPPSFCFAYHDPNKRCPNPATCTYSHSCYACDGRHPRFLCDRKEGRRQARRATQNPAAPQTVKGTSVHAS